MGGQDKTRLRDNEETDDLINVADKAIKTSLRMRKRTVEVPQMRDVDKIVSSRCAETEEGLERPKETVHKMVQ